MGIIIILRHEYSLTNMIFMRRDNSREFVAQSKASDGYIKRVKRRENRFCRFSSVIEMENVHSNDTRRLTSRFENLNGKQKREISYATKIITAIVQE